MKTLERIEKTHCDRWRWLYQKRALSSEQRSDQIGPKPFWHPRYAQATWLVIVVDPGREHIAVAEANKLGIPVLALVDTNCDPDPIDFVIACNDDALKSIKIILQALTHAIIDQKNDMQLTVAKEDRSESARGFRQERCR